jgi:hypothetical protein
MNAFSASVVSILMSRNANLLQKDDNGQTAIDYATYRTMPVIEAALQRSKTNFC